MTGSNASNLQTKKKAFSSLFHKLLCADNRAYNRHTRVETCSWVAVHLRTYIGETCRWIKEEKSLDAFIYSAEGCRLTACSEGNKLNRYHILVSARGLTFIHDWKIKYIVVGTSLINSPFVFGIVRFCSPQCFSSFVLSSLPLIWNGFRPYLPYKCLKLCDEGQSWVRVIWINLITAHFFIFFIFNRQSS